MACLAHLDFLHMDPGETRYGSLFTQAILEGKPIKVFNKGQMIRDFTYIDDIVESIISPE